MSDSWGDGWGTSSLRIYDCLGELLRVSEEAKWRIAVVFSVVSSAAAHRSADVTSVFVFATTPPFFSFCRIRVTLRSKTDLWALRMYACRLELPHFKWNAVVPATSNTRYTNITQETFLTVRCLLLLPSTSKILERQCGPKLIATLHAPPLHF